MDFIKAALACSGGSSESANVAPVAPSNTSTDARIFNFITGCWQTKVAASSDDALVALLQPSVVKPEAKPKAKSKATALSKLPFRDDRTAAQQKTWSHEMHKQAQMKKLQKANQNLTGTLGEVGKLAHDVIPALSGEVRSSGLLLQASTPAQKRDGYMKTILNIAYGGVQGMRAVQRAYRVSSRAFLSLERKRERNREIETNRRNIYWNKLKCVF